MAPLDMPTEDAGPCMCPCLATLEWSQDERFAMTASASHILYGGRVVVMQHNDRTWAYEIVRAGHCNSLRILHDVGGGR